MSPSAFRLLSAYLLVALLGALACNRSEAETKPAPGKAATLAGSGTIRPIAVTVASAQSRADGRGEEERDSPGGLHQRAAGRGLDRHTAQMPADRARLRPILMTTLAIIAGMLSVALGRGDGAVSHASLALVVVGGQALCLLVTSVDAGHLLDLRPSDSPPVSSAAAPATAVPASVLASGLLVLVPVARRHTVV